jgi:hypothetical protein
MKRFLHILLAAHLFFLPVLIFAQAPEPFDNCPGVSVAITRPGTNLTLVPHQIFLIDSTGAITPSGDPIDLQINAFGLNNADGFLYGMYQTTNVANPFLARVGKNGKYENAGTILGPPVDPFKVSLINTAAATMDDSDNYYFTAVVVDLSNVLSPPDIYVGRIGGISNLPSGNDPLTIDYKKVGPGTCLPELLNALQNPLTGVLQDIAFNIKDRRVYTYFPDVSGTGARIGSFDPANSSPVFDCMIPSSVNPSTADLSGLFFNSSGALFVLTTDGKYYKADVTTGSVSLVTQTTLPLLNGNLRGDMASCVSKKGLKPFEGCPGLALAITRPGLNATGGPHHIYTIKPSNGNIQPIGHPIDLQINAFGLNSRDGFLYGMHEVSDIFNPTLARVDNNGDYVDINTISPPATVGSRKGLINTAAATMDGNDNYYFTAVTIDTNFTGLPRLYLGTIRNVSKLNPGDEIHASYRRVLLGSCIDEIIVSLLNGGDGFFQDITYNPQDGKIYTYIQSGRSPSPGKLASFQRFGTFLMLNCIEPAGQPNEPTQDLSGMHSDQNGMLFILTIDGKYYRGNPHNGKISLITQTSLPLLGNNLRGDMASCVPSNNAYQYYQREMQENDKDDDIEEESTVKVSPNPVTSGEVVISVNSAEQTPVELRIMDANGHVTRTGKHSLIKGNNLLRVPVRNLQSGMYAVVLVFPSGRTSATKFIRQ